MFFQNALVSEMVEKGECKCRSHRFFFFPTLSILEIDFGEILGKKMYLLTADFNFCNEKYRLNKCTYQ